MKVPKPRKLPSGNWFIQMRLGGESVPVTEPTEKKCIQSAQFVKAEYLAGKRERKSKGGGPTLRQAIDSYNRFEKQHTFPVNDQGIQNHTRQPLCLRYGQRDS